MEFEIGDDPQGIPDMPEASRSAGIDSRPVFLFRGAPGDPVEAEDELGEDAHSIHHLA